jgi:hypothetical protein
VPRFLHVNIYFRLTFTTLFIFSFSAMEQISQRRLDSALNLSRKCVDAVGRNAKANKKATWRATKGRNKDWRFEKDRRLVEPFFKSAINKRKWHWYERQIELGEAWDGQQPPGRSHRRVQSFKPWAPGINLNDGQAGIEQLIEHMFEIGLLVGLLSKTIKYALTFGQGQ